MYDIQIVIRFAKLTAFQEHLGNFFDGDMVIDPVQPFVVGAAGNGEIFVLLHSAIIKVRLDKIIAGEDPGGITKSAKWEKGGGYRFYELAPTLINEDAFGEAVINPDYDADMLAAGLVASISTRSIRRSGFGVANILPRFKVIASFFAS